MNSLQITKTVPVVGDYDLIVAGGGCAGWVAAVSAARAGLRTALVERYSFLGGTATAGYVVPISGFFFRGKQVVGGIAWEFVERMQAEGAALPEMPKGHVSFNPEYYKRIAAEMAVEAGVTLFTNSFVSGIEREGGRLTHLIIESKNGTEALAARCFIDATGDGDLFRMAGVPMLAPSADVAAQPLSLCFVLGGVDSTTPLLRDCIHHDGKNGKPSCNADIRAMLLDLVERGEAPRFGGPWFNTLLIGDSLAVNMTRTAANAADRADMTRAEQQLRRDMFTLVDRLRTRYPEFAHCEIVASGLGAGVRETRHIRGVSTVTLDDFLSGRTYPCPVAQAAHPMDIHDPTSAAQRLIPLEKDAYIPHTALVAPEADNLIAAGRCISAEAGPYASLRVQATLMSIGEGAGLMAALYCRTGAPVYAPEEEELSKLFAERGFVG